MPRTKPFSIHHRDYDDWFLRHAATYQSELLAVRALLPWRGFGLEIGVGTGRFAAPLGIQVGIDPAREMLDYAAKRSISVVQGIGEELPFLNNSFDYALCVTTLCFVDDATAMLSEINRVLKPDGELVIGFIDRTSKLGQHYLTHQTENVYYRDATFYSGDEVELLLHDAGFTNLVWVQTLSKSQDETSEIESLRIGRGQGAFVVVKANRFKQKND